jgi:Flp pilus assembly protein TadD
MDYLSLCLICKDENDYLPEWLDYHILMGVDRFYIYDNESQVSLRETLKDYIERSWVVVVDISGQAMQLYAYDHCLQTFGKNTFWLGFIDTDVPKSSLDLKELLKGHEQYAGLAVSSLFFGSGENKTRPVVGQIAAYTQCTHATFKENQLIKTIVQSGQTLMPNSPHDFTFKEGAWCVNEGFLRVDGQSFPNSTEKIQLNHYYCRSENEIELKVCRGRGDMKSAWPRKRFDAVNQLATYEDTSILDKLEIFFRQAGMDLSHPLSKSAGILGKISTLAHARHSSPLEMIPPREVMDFREEFCIRADIKTKIRMAIDGNEYEEAKRLMLLLLQMVPPNVNIINLFVDLALVYINLNDPTAAWQALTSAWQLSPNNYVVLGAMAFYFLRVENFSMAENTCRLVLDLAPHDLAVLGMLTHSLIGQGRFEEALKVGIPVVELSTAVSELPDGMSIFLVKQMADYLLTEKKDYLGAVRLWEAGVKCQPEDVNALIELSRCLLLAGDKTGARRQLTQAQKLALQNETVLALSNQVGVVANRPSSRKRH